MNPEEESIMISEYPTADEKMDFSSEESDTELIKDAVRAIRNTRTSMNVPPSKKATVYVVASDEGIRRTFEESETFFETLAKADKVIVQSDKSGIEENAVSAIIPGAEFCIPFEQLVDVDKEIKRLEAEETRLTKEIARCEGMLSNEKFVSKAPEKKVNEEKEKLAGYKQMMQQVKERLMQLR